MSHYHTLLFDLDGTLTDPGEGITNSVAYALRQYGIEVADRRELYPFIGPPLKESFMQYYGFSEEQAEEAVTHYRVYFRERGILENLLYSGTVELLTALKAAGKRVLLATSKPEVFARQILEHFALTPYFDRIYGADLKGTRRHKHAVIAYALEREAITDPAGVVMVGDRDQDVLGAAQNGIPAIGVLYGYGDRAELEAASATAIAATMTELQALLL